MWDWIQNAIILFGAALGIAAYFNADKLRKRLNRMQDVLEEKKITNRFELIPDEKTRELILKHSGGGDKSLSEMVKSYKEEARK